MTKIIRLQSDTNLSVLYEDRTTFGGAIGVRADVLVRSAFAPIASHIHAKGPQLKLDRKILAALRSADLFPAITRAGEASWSIAESVLHPASNAVFPARIVATRPNGTMVSSNFSSSCRRNIHEAVSALCNAGYVEEKLRRAPMEVREFIALCLEKGIACRGQSTFTAPEISSDADVTFLGHNTVVVRHGSTAIMFDPYLHPTSADYPAAYQPIQLWELGPLDAIVLTHSHRDHFDPASLLQIPPSTPVYVPAVERESLLSIDMAYRLEELGFDDVRALQWGDVARIGAITVTALPFYGEQPTDGQWLHPEVRNQGCTYHVKTPNWSCALLADSGREGIGGVKAVAAECRRESGPVDIVFSGYRGWLTYPAQLLGSSVARYALFVPPDYWGNKMQLMNSIDDALDVAAEWNARYLCPYGDGGAPWHWNFGLGPRLDSEPTETEGFDPFPERVALCAAARLPAGEASSLRPVEVLLLRPGESVRLKADDAEILQSEGHRWPFANQELNIIVGSNGT